MKFGGETSTKAYDVQKVSLKTTLYAYVYIVEFYVFILDETDVVGRKLVYKHIWVRNVLVRFHIGPTRGSKSENNL